MKNIATYVQRHYNAQGKGTKTVFQFRRANGQFSRAVVLPTGLATTVATWTLRNTEKNLIEKDVTHYETV